MHSRLLSIFIFTVVFTSFFPEFALAAAADTAVGDMLCQVSGWATGNTGRGIATLSVVIMGILALFNKITWNFAILHIAGIALLEGASAFVNALNAGGAGC